MIDNLLLDARFAFRGLRRDIGFAAAAVAVIALGIGANTAIFSVVNTILFRPVPFQQSDRTVWIANTGTGGLSGRTSRVNNFLDWKKMNKSFEDMAAYFAFFDFGTYNLTGSGDPERLIGVGVSQNFLPFLGVQPVIGRNFTEAEAQFNGPPSIILTHGLWQRRFGADPAVLNKAITLNGRSFTVAGVLPATFDFATVFTPGARIDMLTPFPLAPETDRWGNTLAVMARLRPGVTAAQAQAEMLVMNEQIRRENKDRFTFGAAVTPIQAHLTGRFRQGLLVLLAAVGLVMLIACTNLSNLLLARGASRRKEIAIRAAMGAGRIRLLRQSLTESLVLSLAGSAAGLGLAYGALRFLASLDSVGIPMLQTVRMDGAALAFTMITAIGTGLLFGMVPALQAMNANQADALKESGRGTSDGRRAAWTRGTLVVAEVALACVLLIGAGLLLRSFGKLLEVDLGFRAENTAVWRIEAGPKYAEAARRVQFYDALVKAAEAVPGVESAGLTDALPLGRDRSWGLAAKGVTYERGQYPIGHPRLIDHRYIATMRIPLIAGRNFSEADTAESAPVIIVNQRAARRLWPGEDAIGKMAVAGNRENRVIGVVGNVRHLGLEQEGGLEFYLPVQQSSSGSIELVARTKVPPETVAASIGAALRAVEPALPVTQYQTMGDLVNLAISPRRFLMLLLSGFAGAALLLAAIGIYGVVAYTVAQRRQEIGIRMALGATASRVRMDVLARTAALVGIGAAAGTALSLALSRVAAPLLYGLEPTDPVTFGATIAGLFTMALLAGYIPALRASRVDPMTALRTE